MNGFVGRGCGMGLMTTNARMFLLFVHSRHFLSEKRGLKQSIYLLFLLEPEFCGPLFLLRLAKNSCLRFCFSFSFSFFSAGVMGRSVCGKGLSLTICIF